MIEGLGTVKKKTVNRQTVPMSYDCFIIKGLIQELIVNLRRGISLRNSCKISESQEPYSDLTHKPSVGKCLNAQKLDSYTICTAYPKENYQQLY